MHRQGLIVSVFITIGVLMFVLQGCVQSDARGAKPDDVRKLRSTAAQAIINEHIDRVGFQGESPVMAFVGLENKSGIPMGNLVDSTYQNVDSAFLNSRLFTMVNKRQVDEAKIESKLARISQLLLETHRDRYVRVLGQYGYNPDYLMWGVFTAMTPQSGSRRAKTSYELTLEIIDARTGVTVYKAFQEVE